MKYGLRTEKLKEGKKRQYLVLYNHQTSFDQFFVGMLFKKHLYYVASGHLNTLYRACPAQSTEISVRCSKVICVIVRLLPCTKPAALWWRWNAPPVLITAYFSVGL